MALTRRGRIVIAVTGAFALVAVGGIALALTGHAPAVIQKAVDTVTGTDASAEAPAHLSAHRQARTRRQGPSPAGARRQGREHAGRVSARRSAERRRGLRGAGRGRHHAVHGPVPVQGRQDRSAPSGARARPTRRSSIQYDPHAVIAYSGGQLAVVNDVERSGLVSFDESTGGDAFWRDDTRYEPHNLFLNTAKLRAKSAKQTAGEGPPRRVFPFDAASRPPASTSRRSRWRSRPP